MAAQKDIDKTYLRMCVEWARLSTARRRKVGCLIVKGGQIISDGYNGTPKGFDNNCEDEVNGMLVTKPITLLKVPHCMLRVLHALSAAS